MEGLPIWLSTMILGLGTVFVGLILLIFISELMSAIVLRMQRKKQVAAPAPAAAAAVSEPAPEPEPEAEPAAEEDIPDRGAFVAAVSAVIATVMGEDVSGLRIVSIQKVD